MEPAMSDEELREYDAERALDYQEVQAWERAREQIAAARAEAERLRAQIAELERSLSMACQSPPDDCDCPGCRYADEVMGAGGTP